jgi:hypothetical protein
MQSFLYHANEKCTAFHTCAQTYAILLVHFIKGYIFKDNAVVITNSVLHHKYVVDIFLQTSI